MNLNLNYNIFFINPHINITFNINNNTHVELTVLYTI